MLYFLFIWYRMSNKRAPTNSAIFLHKFIDEDARHAIVMCAPQPHSCQAHFCWIKLKSPRTSPTLLSEHIKAVHSRRGRLFFLGWWNGMAWFFCSGLLGRHFGLPIMQFSCCLLSCCPPQGLAFHIILAQLLLTFVSASVNMFLFHGSHQLQRFFFRCYAFHCQA